MSDHNNVVARISAAYEKKGFRFQSRADNLLHGSKVPVKDQTRLPIRPLPRTGIVGYIPLSKLSSGVIRKKSISIPDAVVAYLDILGFSQKKNQREIEDSLLDFAGPLTAALDERQKLRGTIFSDCAFVSASKENAADLLSALRYAFVSWTADGIPVRGGIAVGKYKETQTYYLERVRDNFISRLFHGSAVTSAVRTEQSGEGALLFATEACSRFYQQRYGEPIYTLGAGRIIGWSDDPKTLYWFAGVSFVRILRLLSLKGAETHPIIAALWNNVKYSMTVNPDITWLVISVILSSPIASNAIRSKVRASLGVDIPRDSGLVRMTRDWLRKNKESLRSLVDIADMDSSITPLLRKKHAKDRLI